MEDPSPTTSAASLRTYVRTLQVNQGQVHFHAGSVVAGITQIGDGEVLASPPALGQWWIGREANLLDLAASLSALDWRGLALVCGEPGVGKSAFAGRFFNAAPRSFRFSAWLPAEDEVSLIAQLRLVVARTAAAPVSQIAAMDSREIVAIVRTYLANTDDWLLVLDNLTDDRLLAKLLPAQLNGVVVVTSRNQDLPLRFDVSVKLRSLPFDVAAAWIAGEFDGSDHQVAYELAEAMGGLPLAIAQLINFMRVSAPALELRDCLDLATASKRTILARGTPSDYPDAVDFVYSVALSTLEDRARDMLRQSSLLAPDNISVSWLLDGTLDVEGIDALSSLRRVGLVDIDASARCIRVHRLLQGFISSESDFDLRAAAMSVTRVLLRELPEQPRTPLAMERLPETMAHALHFRRAISSLVAQANHLPQGERGLLVEFLTKGATCLREIGHAAEALDWCSDASVVIASLPAEHPANIPLLLEFGEASREHGNLADASTFAERAVSLCASTEPLLEAEGRSNLAHALFEMGERERALEEESAAHDLRLRLLGPAARETLLSAHNIGVLHLALGQIEGALRELQHNYKARMERLGATDVDTLASGASLAGALIEADQIEAAGVLLDALEAAWARIGGYQHPQTLHISREGARVLRLSREYDLARAKLDYVLKNQIALLGASHPAVIETSAERAELEMETGEFQLALEIWSEVISARAESLGSVHADTLRSQASLAECHRRAGGYREAIRLASATYENQCEKVGAVHPDCLTTLNTLAVALAQDGQLAPALRCAERVVAGRTRVFGADHSHTRVALANYEEVRRRLSDGD